MIKRTSGLNKLPDAEASGFIQLSYGGFELVLNEVDLKLKWFHPVGM